MAFGLNSTKSELEGAAASPARDSTGLRRALDRLPGRMDERTRIRDEEQLRLLASFHFVPVGCRVLRPWVVLDAAGIPIDFRPRGAAQVFSAAPCVLVRIWFIDPKRCGGLRWRSGLRRSGRLAFVVELPDIWTGWFQARLDLRVHVPVTDVSGVFTFVGIERDARGARRTLGAQWQTIDTFDFVGDLSAVWGPSPDDLWAVGSAGAIAH